MPALALVAVLAPARALQAAVPAQAGSRPRSTAAAGARVNHPRSAKASSDPVLARLPYATITRSAFLRSWARLDPAYRPKGTGPSAKRTFLEQMIQKDLLAHAAMAEPFTMAPLESAQFNAQVREIYRRTVFRRLVQDSARVTPADLDSLRTRLAPGAARKLTRAQLTAAARPFAQRRRAIEVDQRIDAQIDAQWDDSTAAMLVRAYAGLDPNLPDPSKPLSLKLPVRQPSLSAADSGRVLARTSLGPLTAAGFTQRFLGFDPFKTHFPTSVDEVKALGQQILGQVWFDRACQDPQVRNDPEALAAIQERRENVALDHYYARHIAARVDTSEATLRARYQRSPDAYAAPAHWTVTRMPFATQAAADSAQAALAHGTPWDSLCARAFPGGDARRDDCSNQIQLPDPYPEPIFASVLAGLKPGEASVLPMPQSGPDDERRLLVRLVGHVERKFQSFEDARGYVMRDVEQEQSERLLDEELKRLRAEAHPVIDEAALARVDLAAWARQTAPPAALAAPQAAPSGPTVER